MILLALGQAFFSLSVGGGGIIAYGAYLDREASIPKAALSIAGANVSVDMLAGMAIFPIVFAYSLEPASGPGLLFVTLPVAFGQMPGGIIIGTLFLLLVLFAAISTSISMMESVVSRLIEREGAKRLHMTLLAGGMAWLIGLGSVFSSQHLVGLYPTRVYRCSGRRDHLPHYRFLRGQQPDAFQRVLYHPVCRLGDV